MRRCMGKRLGTILIILGVAVLLSVLLPPKILTFILTIILIVSGISLLKSC